MLVYYRGPDALVTDSRFIWAADGAKSFAIADLHKIEIVQRTVSTRVRGLALAAAGTAAVAVAPAWIVLDSVAARFGLVVAALAIVILATSIRRTTRRWDLRAEYRQRDVVLYTSTNPTTFHQISRALRRSVERTDQLRARRRMAAV